MKWGAVDQPTRHLSTIRITNLASGTMEKPALSTVVKAPAMESAVVERWHRSSTAFGIRQRELFIGRWAGIFVFQGARIREHCRCLRRLI